MDYEIVRLRERPERKDEAAAWFHEKWGYPLEAYRESMDQCLTGGSPVPQWYMAAAEGRIVGGLGVIPAVPLIEGRVVRQQVERLDAHVRHVPADMVQ